MSTSDAVKKSMESAGAGAPRPEQMRLLRKLADGCGETFAYPQTEAEAEAEIARLEGRPLSDGLDRWLDGVSVRRGVSWGPRDAAAVHSSEIVDYGSRCHWRHTAR
jgi:hypothetical protein